MPLFFVGMVVLFYVFISRLGLVEMGVNVKIGISKRNKTEHNVKYMTMKTTYYEKNVKLFFELKTKRLFLKLEKSIN